MNIFAPTRILNLIFVLAAGLGAWGLSGCQAKPTKVFQTMPPQVREGGGTLAIAPQTVVLDARPAFEYAMAHLNGSFNMQWDEFSQRKEPFKGLLEPDLFFHSRRLSRLGIGPDTPVIVVGRGLQGQGEEGRLAWTLRYLGVKNVSSVRFDYFSLPLSQAEAAPRASVALWKPVFDESLISDKESFLRAVRTPKTSPGAPIILDVRSQDEYLQKGAASFSQKFGQPEPDVGAINVPWTEFFDEKGLVRKEISTQLSQIGVSSEKEILVICTQGVRSAAVTLALRDLGFSKARNFAGGFRQLVLDSTPASGKRKR